MALKTTCPTQLAEYIMDLSFLILNTKVKKTNPLQSITESFGFDIQQAC